MAVKKIINDRQRARKVYGFVQRLPDIVSIMAAESDASVLSLDWKESVRFASTTNITLPPASPLQAIDGFALSDGDRILLKDQTTSTENGIYEVNVAGSSWDRTADADPGTTLTCGATTYVEEGTINQGSKWLLATANSNIPTQQNWILFDRGNNWLVTGSLGGSMQMKTADAVSIGDDYPSNLGPDIFFFVSGTIAPTGNKKSVFGGSVVVSGSLRARQGLSGSLTKLEDGTSYLVAGTNISIISASNGAVTISGVNDTFTTTFMNGDLVAGVYTANHNLNYQYGTVIVYDNTNKQVIPDDVTATTANSSGIDLTSFSPIAGTWKTTIVGGYNKTYTVNFTNANLVAGILTVTHGLNSQYSVVTVYDNTDKQVIPDDVTATSSTTSTIDLNSFGAIVGTWKVTVKA